MKYEGIITENINSLSHSSIKWSPARQNYITTIFLLASKKCTPYANVLIQTKDITLKLIKYNSLQTRFQENKIRNLITNRMKNKKHLNDKRYNLTINSSFLPKQFYHSHVSL